MNKRIILIIAVILSLCMTAAAKDKVKTDPKEKEEPKIKSYEEIITKDAKTFKGVFTVHRVDEKIYYEIPDEMLGKEFLWVTQLSKAQTGFGFSGMPKGNRVVRWERFGKNILLRDIKYQIHAKEGSPEYGVVKAASFPAVIASYKIACSSADGTPVIDVTDLFVGDVPEFSVKKMLDAASHDKNRTFITSVKVFPINIETCVLATFTPKPPTPLKPGERPGRQRPTEDSISVEVHHSMVKLPDTPMMPRIADVRVGYFGHTYEEYSGPDGQQVDKISLIHRFRLEKKDPNAELSEPVKPIVFYVGRGIPEKYKPYVKQGIEDWIPAFEQAGFKNAIIGKYAPTEAEAPDWDAEDARYSSIRWLPSTIENAYGPHVADPRSGETLEADVLIFHNVLKLARDWFFVQASPNDPAGQKLPLPEELMGKLIRYIVAHEVGHTLGLRHNYKASSTVPVEKVRDAEFTETYGHTPSIMDYARFNYIAQPGDGASLIPRIGPYDRFAIEWGYKPFPGVKEPADEKPFLNKIAARQLTDPLVRFGGGGESGTVGRGDYTSQAEDLGDNAIEATRLGLKNLELIMEYIVPGTSKEGEDYRELKNMYNSLLIQFGLEMGHVANMVGGVEVLNKVYGMGGDVFSPLEASKQKAAVQFLQNNCFRLPSFLPGKDVIKCLGMHDITTQILNVQKRILNALLDPLRVNRIGDIEAAGYKTYPIFDLIGDLTNGIFSEISGNAPGIGIFRRNLQRAYVELLIDNILKPGINGDLRAASRFHLDRLAKKLGTYTAGNGTARSHVRDLHERITAAFKARSDIGQREK
jgi:hypothetical protein